MKQAGDRVVFTIVLLAWAGQLVFCFYYLARFAWNIPYQDDFSLLPVLSGQEPATLEWIIGRLNEHRFPVVRLILLGIARATDYDVRPGFFLATLFLNLSGLVLLMAAWKRTGKASLTDLSVIVFTGSLIHYYNMLQSVGMYFDLFLLLMSVFLAGVMLRFWERRWLPGVMGVTVLLLPINGGVGLIASAPIVLFLILMSASLWRGGGRIERRRAGLQVVFALGATMLALVYVGMGELDSSGFEPEHFWKEASLAFLRSLSSFWGEPMRLAWMHRPGLAFAFMLLFLLAVPLVMWHGFRLSPQRHPGQAGYLAVMAGVLLITIAIGISRAGIGPTAGLGVHYAAATAPFILAFYCFLRCEVGNRLSHVIRWALLVISLFIYVPSQLEGWAFGEVRYGLTRSMLFDLGAGYSLAAVGEKFHRPFYPPSGEVMAERMGFLRDREQSLFGPSPEPILSRPARASFRRVGLVREGESRVEPLLGGKVKVLKRGVALEVRDAEATFRLPPVACRKNGIPVLRLEILASASSTARLRQPDERPATGPWRCEFPLEPGRNTVELLLPDAQISAEGLLFRPGLPEGRYRIVFLGRLELPADSKPPFEGQIRVTHGPSTPGLDKWARPPIAD